MEAESTVALLSNPRIGAQCLTTLLNGLSGLGTLRSSGWVAVEVRAKFPFCSAGGSTSP